MAAQPDGPLMSGNRAARDEERALIAARSAWASSVVVQWGAAVAGTGQRRESHTLGGQPVSTG